MNIITYIKKHIVSGYTLSALLLLCVLFVFSATVHADEDQFIVRQIIGGDTTPPTTPTNLVATAISTTQIDLSWTGSTDNSLTVAGYQVFRDMVFVATTTLTSYSDIDLTPNTTYAYTVTAFDNSVNISEHSATSSATTLALPTVDVEDTTTTDDGGGRAGPATQVEYFSISPDVYSAWIQVGTNVPVKTITKWGITADYELGSVAGPVYLTDHVIQLDGLLPNTRYVVRVEMTDARGRTLIIDNQEFTTRSLPDTFPPENISDFRATPDTSRIVLTWKNPKVDFASVRIVRSDKFFPRDPMEGEVVYEGTGERYVDTDVVPNQPYYYAAFVRDPMGNYSSGALAGARLLNPGESPFVQDLFAGIVQLPRSSIDPLLQNFVVGDIRFMQDGAELAAADSKVTLRGDRDFVIAIDYEKMPEVLKTIVVTLHDPVDSSKTFSFLLRVNKEKTAYEAHVAPLGRAGEYAFTVSILDHKKQGLISVMGSIIATMPDIFSGGRSTWFDYVKQNPIISFSLIALLMILFGIFYKIHRHKAALAATKTLSGALVLLITLAMFAPFDAHAAFNKEINYQGKLTNTSNVSVSDGTYHMRFKLYTVATGGTEVWSEDRSTAPGDRITVSNGLFSVMLGSSTPLSTVDFNQTLYLGVEIGGSAGAASWDGEMTPRKKIGAVPAAVESDRVDGLSSEQFLRSDTSNSTSTATTFLTFIQSGAGKVAEFFNASLASVLSIGQSNVGVGTTTPSAKLAVHALNGETNTNVFAVASSTASATTTLFSINNAGQVTAGSGTFTISSTGAITRLGNGAVSMTSAFLQMSNSGGDVWLQNNNASANSGVAIKAGVSSNDPGSAIKFEAGNSERMRITGNGLVGIGTSTPYARLSVWGAGTGTGLLANFANNASTTVMSIFDNGRVQIGTTSANAVLTVASSTGGVATFGTSNFLEITSPLGTTNTGLSVIGSYLSGIELEGNYQTSSGPNGFTAFSDASTLNTTVSGAGNSLWSIKSSPIIKGTENITEFVGFKASPSSVSSGIHSFGGTAANTSLFSSDLSALLSGTFTNFNIFKGDVSGVGATINNLYGLNMGDITAGTVLNYAIKTGLGLVSFGDKVGIGTSTPYAPLSVVGQVVASYFTATSTTLASTFPYASTTALTVSGSGGFQLATGLNGPLQANSGLVSATTSIGVVYGGTGLTSAPSYGQVLVGNSSGGYTLTATSSLGISGGSSQWTTNSSDIHFTTGNVGIGTTSPYAKLSVVGEVVASYFTATSTTASTFPYASTTALSVSGTAYFPSSGIWNSSGQVGIGTTTPNSIDKIAIRNSGIGGGVVYGDLGGISFSNSDARSSSDFTMNFGMVPYPNGAAQTFYDSYYSECYRGKAGTNANMTGITGCRMREFPWYDTDSGHFVMEDYIRIDNTNSGQVIDNYRPIMSNFDLDTANPRARFLYNAVEYFTINDNLVSANSGGVSFNNDHNMLWLNSATSQGQINLHTFSFGNQTNLSATKLAVVATSTETDLAYIFSVASTTVSGVQTLFNVPLTGGVEIPSVVPASPSLSTLYNTSGTLVWAGSNIQTTNMVANSFRSNLDSAFRYVPHNGSGRSQFFNNNSEVLSLEYGGDVGVGTTTPWGLLSVNPSGISGPSFVVGSSTATHFLVSNGGNVGIGTTSPYAKLSVNGDLVAGTVTATSSITTESLTATTLNALNLVHTGSAWALSSSFGLQLGSARGIAFSSASAYNGVADVGLRRESAGVLAVTAGSVALDAGASLKALYFTASSTSVASTFPYASTTALSISGTGYFPSSGIWNSSGQVGIGTTTPNSIDKISIRNSGLGSASVYGDTGGISITNSHAGVSSDYTINVGYVPYPNGAAQTFYDAYAANCFRGKAGTNANMTGITGCRISEFPWYDTTSGHFVMEDYIRIDNTNSGQVIDNYRPIMSNFDIDTANPRARFAYNAVKYFTVNDNLVSANSGGVSFNNDHNMLWLNSATSQGQINLKTFSFGNQTNLSTTKLAVVATSTETDLTDIFTVASTSVGGSVTKYFWVPRTGGIGLSQLTPASTPNGVLYNDSSGNLTWNGGSSITGATVINTGNAGLTLALSVKRTSQFDSGVSSQSAITAFGRASQSIDIFNIKQVAAGQTEFNVGFSPDYKVGVGTTTPWAKFSVNASGLTAGVPQFVVGSSTATHLIVANGGNVGVGSTTPWRKFSVTGTVAMSGLTSSATGNAVCITTGKDITDAGAASCTPSSERFKENIEALEQGFALDKLNQLRVVSFDYKEGFYSPEDAPHAYGMIAEEVENIDPLLVDYGYDGQPQTLQFEKILALTVQAVQELSQGNRMAGISAAGVIEVLNSLGMQIADGIAYLKGLVVESLTVGSPEKPTGITIYDEVTGEPYCLKIASGKMKNVPGECTKEEDDTSDNGGGTIAPVEPEETKQTEITPVDDGGDPVILPVDEGGAITPTDPGVGVDQGGEVLGGGGDEQGAGDTGTPAEAPEDTGGDDGGASESDGTEGDTPETAPVE